MIQCTTFTSVKKKKTVALRPEKAVVAIQKAKKPSAPKGSKNQAPEKVVLSALEEKVMTRNHQARLITLPSCLR